MKRIRALGLLVLSLALGVPSPAGAQPYGSDLIVSHYNGRIYRVNPAGKFTTIGDYSPAMIYSLAWDVDNRHLLAGCASFLTATKGHILRIDPVSGSATTVIPTSGNTSTIALDQNGNYVFSAYPPGGASAAVLRVMRNSTNLTTIRGGFMHMPAMFRERSSGDWLGGDTVDVLHRYTPDWSQVIASAPHTCGYTYEMDQDPHTLDVYVGAAALFRFDPGSNKTTLITRNLPSLVGARGVAADRSPGALGGVFLVTDGNGTAAHVYRYDRSGRRLATLATLPDRVTDLVFDRARNLGAIRIAPPNDRLICLSFPGEGGKPYVLALSLSGYTRGLNLPDGRVIPLRLDPLVALTTRGPLPPFLTGNHGILNASGEAVARLDLNGLGGNVQGVRFWAVALSLDPHAPFGISTISKPILVMME